MDIETALAKLREMLTLDDVRYFDRLYGTRYKEALLTAIEELEGKPKKKGKKG